MATDGGGGVVDGRARRFQARILVPGWNPNPDANLFFAYFCIQIDQNEFIQLYKLYSTNSYKYKLYSTNSYNSYIFYTNYLLIAQSLLTEVSKISCPESCFFFWSIRSSSVSYVRALYTGASQYIANWSDSSWFVVGFWVGGDLTRD